MQRSSRPTSQSAAEWSPAVQLCRGRVPAAGPCSADRSADRPRDTRSRAGRQDESGHFTAKAQQAGASTPPQDHRQLTQLSSYVPPPSVVNGAVSIYEQYIQNLPICAQCSRVSVKRHHISKSMYIPVFQMNLIAQEVNIFLTG